MKHPILLMLLMHILSINVAVAQGKLVKMGDVTLTEKYDNESIITSGKQQFQSIQLKAVNEAIQITAIEIWLQNGEPIRKENKIAIDAGQLSAPIAIKSGQIVKKVVVFYKLFAGKSDHEVLLELYGNK